MSIECSRNLRFQGGYEGGDAILGDITYILWNCIENFTKGKECHLDVGMHVCKKQMHVSTQHFCNLD